MHTHGPWTVTPDIRHVTGDNRGKLCVVVCDLAPLGTAASYLAEPGTISEIESNARLIAAAPDLLAALEDVLAFFRQFDGPAFDEINHPALDAARAAIAKARG